MKQFIFIAIAIVFITSLLPANLSCQMEVEDPPQINLGVPWDHPENYSLKIGTDRSGKVDQNKEMISEHELIRKTFQFKMILNKHFLGFI